MEFNFPKVENFRFYSIVLLPLLLEGALLICLPGSTLAGLGRLEAAAMLLWLLGAASSPYVYLSLAGIFLYGSPRRGENSAISALRNEGWGGSGRLVVCFVSYGSAPDVLRASVDATEALLECHGVDYEIEVVTETAVSLSWSPRVIAHVVPSGYRTPNGSLSKARACHYAIDARAQRLPKLEKVWVLHMDEESVLNESALAGIRSFIRNPLHHGKIGQGEIKYNSVGYAKRPLIAAIDSIRTGHDLGYFRLQYRLLKGPLLGAHGSFLLVPAEIEQKIGIDNGPRGSITEDAFFGLNAYQRGERFGWIEGFIQEQSPISLVDLLRQRRRWINGLMLLAVDRRIKLSLRLLLMMALSSWRICLLAFAALTLLVSARWVHTGELKFLALPGLYWVALGTIYLTGAYRNTEGIGWKPKKRALWLLTVFVLTPVAAFIETAALIYAVVSPSGHFHIVKKIAAEDCSQLPETSCALQG